MHTYIYIYIILHIVHYMLAKPVCPDGKLHDSKSVMFTMFSTIRKTCRFIIIISV